jgi:uncharacterized protein
VSHRSAAGLQSRHAPDAGWRPAFFAAPMRAASGVGTRPVARLVVLLAVVVAAASGFGRTLVVSRGFIQTLLAAPAELPELTAPVNDFAHVIDAQSAQEIDRVSRALQAASGDVIVVATVPDVDGYADIHEYAVKLFENRGRGIGEKGKDNGLLILLALRERKVWSEVGYGLEQWITDGYAGETARQVMVPEFRNGRYGAGLLAATVRYATRIAQGRNVQLTGVAVPRARRSTPTVLPFWWLIIVFIAIMMLSRIGGGPGRGVRRWGRGGWSGWSSGVGPFGGGFGGGSGGGGFGGGFGGFGGGGSGGGGGGAGW